jgi:hypothetical protein
VVENGNLVLELKWSDKAQGGKGGGQGATIPTIRWLQYGTISARIRVAPGRGVVSSFITKTDISDTVGDEIDFEMLGANPREVQTNWYTDGQIDYTKGSKWNFPSTGSTQGDYHVYTIEWFPNRVRWLVDNNEIRSMTPDASGKFPKMLGRAFFSVWDAGCNTAEGTAKWAGGVTDWCTDASKRAESKKMYVDWFEVKCATEDKNGKEVYMPNLYKEGKTGGGSNFGGGTGGAGASPRDSTNKDNKGGNTGSIIGGASALYQQETMFALIATMLFLVGVPYFHLYA